MRAPMGKRPFMARFEWWPDVRFWGGYALTPFLIAAGIFGIWYEVIVVGEYVCFHSTWGTGALVWAGAILFWNTRRLRRFNALMADKSVHGFLDHKDELEEDLVPHLPRKQRRAYKERLAQVTERSARRRRESDAAD